MFSDKEFITDDEKIDAIYRFVRKRRWIDIIELLWKWTIRLSIIFSLWYVIIHPTVIVEMDIQKKVSGFVSSIATPIAKDMIGAMGKNGVIPQPSPDGSWIAPSSPTVSVGGRCIMMTDSGTLIMPDGREVPLLQQ